MKNINEALANLNLNPRTPKERFNLLQHIVMIIHKISEISEEFKEHIEFERAIVYPKLERANCKKKVNCLEEIDKNIEKLLNEIKNKVEKYRSCETRVECVDKTVPTKFLMLERKIMHYLKLEKRILEKAKIYY